MDLFVHYNDTGLDLYLQFDDSADTRIPFVEGTADKLRRYVVTQEDVVSAGVAAGTWNPSVRFGDYTDPQDDDLIVGGYEIKWTGTGEVEFSLSQEDIDYMAGELSTAIAEQGLPSGGGTLSARIGIISLTSQDFLEIVQGEQKTITLIVEAHGRFDLASFNAITVKLADVEGTVITKTEGDGSIVRVCEEYDVQVIRCTLTDSDTSQLTEGLLQIEIAFDDQKARLTHSLKILETLSQGS